MSKSSETINHEEHLNRLRDEVEVVEQKLLTIEGLLKMGDYLAVEEAFKHASTQRPLISIFEASLHLINECQDRLDKA